MFAIVTASFVCTRDSFYNAIFLTDRYLRNWRESMSVDRCGPVFRGHANGVLIQIINGHRISVNLSFLSLYFVNCACSVVALFPYICCCKYECFAAPLCNIPILLHCTHVMNIGRPSL